MKHPAVSKKVLRYITKRRSSEYNAGSKRKANQSEGLGISQRIAMTDLLMTFKPRSRKEDGRGINLKTQREALGAVFRRRRTGYAHYR
ncbi:MAG: hypothetical protein CMD92_03480 [Gammaproteobacteria bacterium]|nr:hypothetical protein [Gammaproteobacteria bacterium]HBW82671.1 hypothetical protein [Gammaproteobacteria bacterium]